MQLTDVKSSFRKLEKLMRGLNFVVTLGIELFENCKSYNDFALLLKNKIPKAQPDQVKIIEYEIPEFWNELFDAFNYRGSKTEGHFIDGRNETGIQTEQKKIVEVIKNFITDRTKIYAYPDSGLPGYPVYWEFAFIIFKETGQCLFIYGSASD